MTRTEPRTHLSVELLEARDLPAILTVDAAANLRAIDPNIYGTAYATTTQLQNLNIGLHRMGGNNTSRYNWQVNADNRGSDWYFQSIADGSATAGERGDTFIQNARNANAQAMMTIPTVGWVAKVGPNRTKLASYLISRYGPQTGNDWQWFPDAGNGIRASDGRPITWNDPNDASVPAGVSFQQGWVQHLLNRWGPADSGGLRYYILDNEPSLWHATHQDVHGVGATMAEVRDKTIAYATMIKDLDPGAIIVGPEEWGWSGYFFSGYDQQWGANNGWGGPLPDRAGNGNWDYLPWFLNQMRLNHQATGRRLLDVFTVHWYPQAGEFSDSVTTSMQLLRNRGTRSLWDTSYVDQSWIGSAGPDGGIVRLIPRLRQWVNSHYPGTQIGITEYNWGAEGHMNGATTQADVLGIFGREGLNMANRWATPATNSPTYLAMRMYRNYDGNRSTFGETSVAASAPNPDEVSVFASRRASDGALTIMVINKNLYSSANPGATTSITVNFSNFAAGSAAEWWQLAATNPANQTQASITRRTDVAINGSSFTIAAPMQSVSLFVIRPATYPTSTTLVSSLNPAELGSLVTFTATVTAATGTPQGTVTFRNGSTTLGTATLNAAGVATFSTSSLPEGTHAISAVYAGSGVHLGSTSNTVQQVVGLAPTIDFIQVDDGGIQRSVVRQILVSFSSVVNLTSSAFTLTLNTGAPVPGTNLSWTTNNSDGRTLATITFSGSGVEYGSLADGRYRLTVNANGVTDAGSGLAMSSNVTRDFFRLFGDLDGNAITDKNDWTLFREFMFSRPGDPNYRPYCDYDLNGLIDKNDYVQWRIRLGKTV